MSKILLKGLRVVNGVYRCNYCGGIIEDGDIYISKRNKVYYCITCAEVLNMVTSNEIKESLERFDDMSIKKADIVEHHCSKDKDQIEFTLTPVDKKEIKKKPKSRAEIKAELNERYRRRY